MLDGPDYEHPAITLALAKAEQRIREELAKLEQRIREEFDRLHERYPYIVHVGDDVHDAIRQKPTDIYRWLVENIGQPWNYHATPEENKAVLWSACPSICSIGFKREEYAVAFTLWLQ